MFDWLTYIRPLEAKWSYHNATNCINGFKVCKALSKTSASNRFKKSQETLWIMRRPKRKRMWPRAKQGRRLSSRKISRRLVRLARCLPLSRDQPWRRKNSLHSPLLRLHRSHLNRLARVLQQDLLVQTQTTILPMYVNAVLKPNSFNCRVGSMFVRSAYWMRFMRRNHTKMSIWRCSTKCRTLWG